MAVLEVARTSKNIKGCLIKKIKDAIEDIQGGVRALTSDKRMERLLEENKRLTERLNALEEAQGKSAERRTAPAAQEEEERMKRIMLSVGTMMDARLAGITSRLPPEPVMRPPLAADRRRAEVEAAGRGPKPGYSQVLKAAPAPKTSAPKTAPTPAPRQAPKPTPKPDPKPAKGKAKKSTGQPAPALAPATEETPALAPAPQEPVAGTSETVEDGWTTVSKKKKAPKSKAPERPVAKPAKTPPAKKKEGKKPSTKGPKKESGRTRRRRGQRQRRLARTAAVVLTISEEGAQKALTYETVLRQARETIDLDKMGVDMVADPIRIRRAQTGARILELPKNIGREAADDMAKQLRAKYGDDVKVTTPVRCAELRVTNLDESVTREDILGVATRQGQCAPDQIKVGELRPSPGAKFSAVMKCPLEVASKLVTSKTQKFLVGWSSARVVQLDARPMKCFRCLALGHTRI
ncbi:MAP7 domain-containing protein 1-like [Trichoplusia ni]|uniref:MAP7 domain-containing protein 1-like n=1 Tax=Trichoplusia ni TaxID=7111 RepID=A0A7E5X2N5_TRINI|nr:MAP7 domain-containing protein 1-like [Trichoplusia ni]